MCCRVRRRCLVLKCARGAGGAASARLGPEGRAGTCFPLSVRNGSALPALGWGRGGCQGASCQGCSTAHRGWTHTHSLLGGLTGVWVWLSFFITYLFDKKSSSVLLLRSVLLLHPWRSRICKQRNSTALIKT